MATRQLPYLLRISEQALALGDTLLLPAPQNLPELWSAAKPVEIERTLLAYRIPYLPDLLTSPNLSGATERERLAEILDQQARFVANLGKWKGMAFALRFCSQPARGEIEVAFIARGVARSGHGRRLGEQMALDVAALLSSFDYPVEPVGSETGLRAILEPVSEPFVVEVRQHEEVVSMEVVSMIEGECCYAYIVYPFRPSLTTWIPAFRTLMKQQSPCVISVYLEPTELYQYERKLFAQTAQRAETYSDFTFDGRAYHGRLADPVARVVARFYTDYLQRLTVPLLLTVQVGSPDPMVARNVAQALAAEITETQNFTEATQGATSLPSGFDLVLPETAADLQAARRTLTTLDLCPWGRSEAPEGRERLRYLVDASTASAAFRFPVAIRGGIPGVKTRQLMPSYEVGPRTTTVASGEIQLGTFADQGGAVGVPTAAFNSHTLVAGTTRSGKTTTCTHLLSQLWEQEIPFLVIEPAKIEYRAFLASPLRKDLQIFTLGDESISPFRLNPLEILPGVRVETHISYMRACFEAALPTFGILPSLIEESLHNIYLAKGWNLTDRGRTNDERLMPTLGELYFEIIRVTEERGYSDKTLQDIRAAAAGRIGSLLRGSKGRMLNTRRSVPMADLMTRPTVLELESLNDEEKALVMLFLLTLIREHCRSTRTESKLQHVTLIEEAHRIMSATPHAPDREVSADTRAEAVGMFSAALSEMGGFGEGLIVVEQIPRRLAEDALKNTNIKIVHKLPGQDDRQAVGGTMNLDQEQEPYLAKLAPGQAAFFVEGYEKPTFITIPDYRSQHKLPKRVADEQVETHMASFREANKTLLLPFDGCKWCLRQCLYRDRVAPVAYELESGQRFRKALWTFEKQRSKGDEATGWTDLVKACQEAVQSIGLASDVYAAYCYFAHLFGYEVTRAMAEQFRQVAEGE
jgi:hypothetical protein